jgi:hypothetical protein
MNEFLEVRGASATNTVVGWSTLLLFVMMATARASPDYKTSAEHRF